MRITITQRLKPFSHTQGALCVLPGSSLRLQIFPTLIRVHDLSEIEPVLINEFSLQLCGPVKDFTIQEDLERGRINVWGHYQEGYVRYHIAPEEEDEKCILTVEKSPIGGISFSCLEKSVGNKEAILVGVECVAVDKVVKRPLPMTDRLSLGSHKAQDWDLVKRRADLAEILPIWLMLGQLVPAHQLEKNFLLSKCEEVIRAKDKEAIVPSFLNLFHACFEGILSPRLTDTQHQGLIPSLIENQSGSPLVLLSRGADLIRDLFVKSDGGELQILPHLPPEFHCGRYIGIECSGIGTLDIEWTKKTIRRMILRSNADMALKVVFQKRVKKYRLRDSFKDRGKALVAGQELLLEAGRNYYFDNFTK